MMPLSSGGPGAFNMPMPDLGGGPISGAASGPGYPPTSFLPNSGGYVSFNFLKITVLKTIYTTDATNV